MDIKPFQLNVGEDQLEDLRRRLANTRWPERETVEDWSQGIPLAYTRELADYWQHQYDWRRWERKLNGWEQFTALIEGIDIHFLHLRSPHAGALPMVMTHGWPGSIVEFHKIIGPLLNPPAHGGRAEDAFHLVLPTLPGYGFSGKPVSPGTGVDRIAGMWGQLMAGLGYSRYVAQGGDWGSLVTLAMGESQTGHCAGIHVNMPIAAPTEDSLKDPSEQEKAALERMNYYQRWDSGYSKQQSSRPQTLGYGLADSPVGQMAWIVEKFWAWTDCDAAGRQHPENVISKDELLDNVMMYWLTNSATSSARLYWESFDKVSMEPIHMPAGISIFPREIFGISRRWAEQRFSNIIHWNHMPRGGHFPALEQPELLVQELRDCFGQLRQ